LPDCGHGADEVGLAAQEGGRLQHVDHGGHRRRSGLRRGRRSAPALPISRLTLARISRPCSMPGPRKLVPLDAVGLVESCS
jgi:hypothetical protein